MDTAKLRTSLRFTDPIPSDLALQRTIAWEAANSPVFDPAEFNYPAEDAAITPIATP